MAPLITLGGEGIHLISYMYVKNVLVENRSIKYCPQHAVYLHHDLQYAPAHTICTCTYNMHLHLQYAPVPTIRTCTYNTHHHCKANDFCLPFIVRIS